MLPRESVSVKTTKKVCGTCMFLYTHVLERDMTVLRTCVIMFSLTI